MGCGASKPPADKPPAAGRSGAVDRLLIDAVMRHAETHPAAVKSLDQVLLRLPAVRDVFNGCRSVFKATDKDGDGRIQLSEFQESALALQLQLPQAVLEDVYHQADMNNDRTIDFREFVVLLVLVWLLRGPQEAGAGVGKPPAGGMDKAMDTLVAAFRFFDKDNSGSIDREEVFQALDSDDVSSSRAKHHSAPRSGAGQAASKHRFQEMDFSKDGKVTFPEFVLAVETWAGVDEE